MNKSEREELRRLLRARFKLLRADVEARQAELEQELRAQVEAKYADMDRRYDDAMFRVKLAVDESNRKINDIGRELHGAEAWGIKTERVMVTVSPIPKPGVTERREDLYRGTAHIQVRVRNALLQLGREENDLLTELATSALESTEAKQFFNRIPSASELVPAYRLNELTR